MSRTRTQKLKAFLLDLKESVIGFEELDFTDINQCAASGENALHRAIWQETDVEIIRELIELGIDVNAVPDGDLNRTALHTAVSKGNHETIELLLDNGANLFAIDDLCGQPPFYAAMQNKREDLVHLIMGRIFGVTGRSGNKEIDQSWLKFHERHVERIRKSIERESVDR